MINRNNVLNDFINSQDSEPQSESYNFDFTTWESFGILWSACNSSDWFEDMLEQNCKNRMAYYNIIHPNVFANMVYEYLTRNSQFIS